MLSGRRLNLVDPSPLDIEIEDIAHGLARVARWNGQTIGAHIYSVAQHSVLVEHIVRLLNPSAPPRTCLTALLHDAPEYVVGDMISPFKAIMGGSYREVEQRLIRAVHIRFGLPPDPPGLVERLVKKADRQAALFEAVLLAGFSEEEALPLFGEAETAREPLLPLITPWPAEDAESAFLQRFEASRF
jgi:5'-deoxynucleotidase YfbR-like HD superfamily hydrolase